MELATPPNDRDRQLEGELEQALVTAEDVQQQNAALLEENAALREEIVRLSERLAANTKAVNQLESQSAAPAEESLDIPPSQTEEELRAAIEELQVMAEELELANEKLREYEAGLRPRQIETLERANPAL